MSIEITNLDAIVVGSDQPLTYKGIDIVSWMLLAETVIRRNYFQQEVWRWDECTWAESRNLLERYLGYSIKEDAMYIGFDCHLVIHNDRPYPDKEGPVDLSSLVSYMLVRVKDNQFKIVDHGDRWDGGDQPFYPTGYGFAKKMYDLEDLITN